MLGIRLFDGVYNCPDGPVIRAICDTIAFSECKLSDYTVDNGIGLIAKLLSAGF